MMHCRAPNRLYTRVTVGITDKIWRLGQVLDWHGALPGNARHVPFIHVIISSQLRQITLP
jgi:hypothetical protein